MSRWAMSMRGSMGRVLGTPKLLCVPPPSRASRRLFLKLVVSCTSCGRSLPGGVICTMCSERRIDRARSRCILASGRTHTSSSDSGSGAGM